MWNYEPGQMRCDSGHVFAIQALEGVQAKVVRVDRPSRRERLQDVAVGFFAAGALAIALEILQHL